MKHLIKALQATAASILRGGRGVSGTAHPNQPEQLFELYEMEGCPYCRRVREVLTLLNLDYISYPCPKNGTKYRPKVTSLTGKAQFPFLIDPNTGTHLQESQQIIDYLFAQYGKTGKTPSKWQNLGRASMGNTLATAVTGMRGLHAAKNNAQRNQPSELLVLYTFEGSPFSRLVRERLCELELAYINRNVAKERWQDMGMAVARLKPGKYVPLSGGKREQVFNGVMQGRIQVPFLIDPNTQTQLFESKDILDYLNQTYARACPQFER